MVSVQEYLGGITSFVLSHTLRRMFILFLFLLLNPFELSSENDRKLRDDWQSIYAERYQADHGGSGSGLDMVTVLTMTREDEAELSGPRPLDTYDYAELLQRLNNLRNAPIDAPPMKPLRAIFIDMFLDHGVPKGWTGDAIALTELTAEEKAVCARGRSDKAFTPFRCAMDAIAELTGYHRWKATPTCFANPMAKIACIRRAGGLPIIFAENRPRIDAPLQRARSVGEEALHRVALGVPVQTSMMNYWLAAPMSATEREKKDFDLSPAAALYWAHCLTKNDAELARPKAIDLACIDSPAQRPSSAIDTPSWQKTDQGWNWSRRFDTPIEVVWGIGGEDRFTGALASIESETRRNSCRTATPTPTSLWRKLLSRSVSGITHVDEIHDGKLGSFPCPYTHAITLQAINRATPEIIKLGIEDRIILIGRADEDADHVIVKPLGKLPGVLLHAMALQNLIDLGKAYPKVATPYLDGVNFTDRDAIGMAGALWTILLGGIAIHLARHRNERTAPVPAGKPSSARIWLPRLAIAMLFVTLVIGPLSWILQTPSPGASDGNWFDQMLPDIPADASYSVVILAVAMETWSVMVEISEPARKSLATKGPIWALILGHP